MSDIANTEYPVEFLSDGVRVRGAVKYPNGDGPFSVVILGHGLGGLKEWTLPEVADALVSVGIAGLWFDYRNFGDSDGLPREEISHYGRLEDWFSAVSYASSLPKIDQDRIGVWGTSLGGRDALIVSSIDRRIKAVLAQTPLIKWYPPLASRMSGYADNLDAFQKDLNEDHINRVLGRDPRYLPFMKTSGDDAKESYLQQLTESELRNYRGRLSLQSYRATALNDATPFVERISPTPVCFILAEEDFLPGQMEAYQAAKEPKSLVTIKGHHFSPYMTSKRSSVQATIDFFAHEFLEPKGSEDS